MHTLFSRITIVVLVFAASTEACAQNAGPNSAGTPAKPRDAREIVSLSVAATERSWEARDHYSYLERDQDRRIENGVRQRRALRAARGAQRTTSISRRKQKTGSRL